VPDTIKGSPGSLSAQIEVRHEPPLLLPVARAQLVNSTMPKPISGSIIAVDET
jgi:hypothetical protein